MERLRHLLARNLGQHGQSKIDTCRHTPTSEHAPVLHHATFIWERNWCGPVKSRRKDNDPLLRAMARHIGILLYPDFQLLDAAAPITSFSIAGAWRATPLHLSAPVTRGAGEATDVPA